MTVHEVEDIGTALHRITVRPAPAAVTRIG